MPKKRVLSEFLCRELLYDYVSGRLDKERAAAVDECLAESEDVRDDLRAIKEGVKYAKILQNTQLGRGFVEELSKPAKGMKEYLEQWKTLPKSVRIGSEAALIVLLVGVTLLLVPKEYAPWNKNTPYTLIEITKDLPEFADSNDTTTTTLLADNTVMYGPPTTLAVVAGTMKTPAPPPPLPPVPKPPAEAAAVAVAPTPPAKPEKKTKGEIYRVYMTSNQVDEVSPAMVEKILALGGQKAGEVELGWKRQQGRYFHFSMPEANLEQLKIYMQNLGPVRIVKEPHVRVMPQGMIRLILWLEAGTTKNNDNQEEPEEGNP